MTEPMPYWRAVLWVGIVICSLGYHDYKMTKERNLFYKRAVMVEAFVAVEHHMDRKHLDDFNKRLDAIKLPKGVLLTDN